MENMWHAKSNPLLKLTTTPTKEKRSAASWAPS